MHVNRLKRYFDDLDTTREKPLTSAVAFEIFVQSPDRDFTHRLSRVMAALRKDRETHRAPTQALLQIILCPCFIQTTEEQSLFQIEFIGDSSRARRVLCAAALIFVTGWDQLPAEARQWSRELLICAIPSSIAIDGLRDLANAKTLIGSMMSGMSFQRPAHNKTENAGGGLIDPFIGL